MNWTVSCSQLEVTNLHVSSREYLPMISMQSIVQLSIVIIDQLGHQRAYYHQNATKEEISLSTCQ